MVLVGGLGATNSEEGIGLYGHLLFLSLLQRSNLFYSTTTNPERQKKDGEASRIFVDLTKQHHTPFVPKQFLSLLLARPRWRFSEIEQDKGTQL